MCFRNRKKAKISSSECMRGKSGRKLGCSDHVGISGPDVDLSFILNASGIIRKF